MMCTMLVNMLTCKHVIQIATRRRLSIFSGGTDMLICRRVSFKTHHLSCHDQVETMMGTILVLVRYFLVQVLIVCIECPACGHFKHFCFIFHPIRGVV